MLTTFLLATAGAFFGTLLFNTLGYVILVYRSKRMKRRAEDLINQLKNSPGVKVVSSQEELADLMMGGSSSKGDPTSWN